MKKQLSAALTLLALGAQAQTLEERVEALEFANYENFFKVSGQLEMRFDSVSRENKKRYTQITDATAYGTALQTAAAGGQIAAGQFLAGDCGDTINSVKKNGCTTVKDNQNDNTRYGRLFFNLNFESNPTNKLSFYGRLSMAKYLSEISSTGNRPNSAAFSDLRSGAQADQANVWVERAFANYSLTDNATLTFGRLPTIDGAPQHHHTQEPMAGNYPIMAFSAIFDGIAYTHKLNANHTLRAVYSPFSTPNFNDPISRQNNPNGDRISRMEDAWAGMYEYSRDNLSFAKRVHVIAMHNYFHNMPIAGTTLELGIQRTSLYAEALNLMDSNIDIAIHGMSSTTNSRGSAIGLSGKGGWLTTEDEDTTSGSAYGILAKYNFRNMGILSNSSFGAEYFHGEEGAFLYDSANIDPVSMYITYGTAYRLFYTKDFEGGLKWNIQYLNQQQDYYYSYAGLIGDKQEVDRSTSFVSTSLIANF